MFLALLSWLSINFAVEGVVMLVIPVIVGHQSLEDGIGLCQCSRLFDFS